MPRAEQKKFARLMTVYVLGLGRPDSRTRSQTSRDYEIDTPLGPLGVSFSGSPAELETFQGRHLALLERDSAHVHCAFEYPRVAHQVLGDAVNPYSGKWNFYYGKGWTGQAAFDDWKMRVEQIRGLTWVLPPLGQRPPA